MLISKLYICIKLPLPKAQGSVEGRVGKLYYLEVVDVCGETVFARPARAVTHINSAAVMVFIRSTQDLARQNQTMDRGRGHEVSHLPKKLLVIDGFWRG